MAFLVADGQIIQGVAGKMHDIGCNLEVVVKGQKFSGFPTFITFDSKALEQVCPFEDINRKRITLTIH